MIVIHADLSIDIYGYPLAIFQPTDFHSATLVGNHIYIIGCLGYHGTLTWRPPGLPSRLPNLPDRAGRPGTIPVGFTNTRPCTTLRNMQIKITKGEIFLRWEGKRQSRQNRKSYWLDLATGEWTSGQRKRRKENGK
ncbi:MAG: hypothetical protein R2867_18265 [Caldilineaceae bacterium]